ncbi:hypothetical protein FJZ36_15780 [Candidatus Poribacteria bacterium]|nr:hypothetical protein [Candidatus Poribacteria bacterium]
MARTSRIWIAGSAASTELRALGRTATPWSRKESAQRSTSPVLRLDPLEHWSLDRIALPEYSDDSPTMGIPA